MQNTPKTGHTDLTPVDMDYDATCAFIGVKKPTLYSMVSRKQIPHYRLGPRLVRFRRDELEAWLRQRHSPVASEDSGQPADRTGDPR